MEFVKSIIAYEDRHPYLVAFTISCGLTIFILFFSPNVHIVEQDNFNRHISIVNYDEISAPKRRTQKDITTDPNASPENAIPERAVGTSLEARATDLAFYPNVAAPHLISKLRKNYPQIAKDNEVEALVATEVVLDETGEVRIVRVLGVRLTKEFPKDLADEIKLSFKTEAMKTLKGARFTPPVVGGRNVPLKMELPLRFRLDD